MKSAREQKGTELGLCKDCRIQTAFFTHPTVDLVERSPSPLLTNSARIPSRLQALDSFHDIVTQAVALWRSRKLVGTIDHSCRGLCTRGFAEAAFEVMVAYGGVAFGQGDSCGKRKG